MKQAAGLPFVSVVVPCRNEARFIRPCLESILAGDYPAERVEILIIDGMSDDGTRNVVTEFVRRHSGVTLLDNAKRTIPAAMNIGIRHAQGEVLMKADVHSTYPRGYVSSCVRSLEEYQADNVGGVLRIMPGEDSPLAKAIALTLAHPFGSGDAYVKTGARRPRWADTAAFGCYRRVVVEKIGLWNENLAGSSDLDFNVRLREAGGKILLVPDIVIDYFADPNLKALWRHSFSDGVWATYVLKFRSKAWRWRHWVPLGFVASAAILGPASVMWPLARPLVAGIGGCYLVLSAVSSLQIATRERDPQLTMLAFLAFAVRHLAHGLGAAWGLVLLMLPGVRWHGRRASYM